MSSILDWLGEKLAAQRDLPSAFPKLRSVVFEVKSRWTLRYNCLAFALHHTDQPWWPSNPKRTPRYYFWPTDIPRKETVKSFRLLFEKYGYQECGDSNHETGWEKIALYVNEDGVPKHVARQLDSGVWVSKLGDAQDIHHHSIEGVEGDRYGTAQYFFRKQLTRRNEGNDGDTTNLL